ncbi:MAG: hypothetical protein CFK49_05735 [Armatimonadetes bacterium JP3_11]|nr:MAG: hypothetical protein CFK49_05735 [Armatimonadetes bacterium JP3_11]RMH06881.1 MAG: hypothetical protein D6697_09810 [Armatimonadota bacterium]
MKRLRHKKGMRVKLHSTGSLVRAHRGGAWTGLSTLRVPIQEPTGKFALTKPAAKPIRRRMSKPCRVRQVALWLWRNAEPIGWAAVFLALSLSLWFSPRTQLTRITVQGVPAEARATIEQVIRNRIRLPLPLTDAPRQIERALHQQPWIAAAQWRAAGVGAAELHIAPRIPEVLIEDANGARIFADPTGFLFLPPNPRAKPVSGRIQLGQDYPMPQQGSFLEGEMRRAFTILQAIHPRVDVRNPRALVSKTQGVRLWLEIQRGAATLLQVRFGDASALDTQLQSLTRILDTPTYRLEEWDYIDISTPNAEVVKPRSTPPGGEP